MSEYNVVEDALITAKRQAHDYLHRCACKRDMSREASSWRWQCPN